MNHCKHSGLEMSGGIVDTSEGYLQYICEDCYREKHPGTIPKKSPQSPAPKKIAPVILQKIVLNSLEQLPKGTKCSVLASPFGIHTTLASIEVVVNPMLPPDLILMMDDHGNIGVLQRGSQA